MKLSNMERVNNIFKKFDKKITIPIGIFFLIIYISAGLLKISLNIIYPGNDLSVLIKESIRNTFGKAVKFDSYYFRYDGNIVLLNFYLSNKTDFNDNLNLIKCDEIVIDTDLASLFRKDILISGVYIYDPEINILKNYGKSYFDIITDNFTSGINMELFDNLAGNGFVIKLYNSSGSYREVFKNGKNIIDFNDLDIRIKYSDKKIRYSAAGDISKRNKTLLDTCSFSINGEVSITDMRSENHIRIKNFDIIQIEEFLRDKNITDYDIRGELYADIQISHENNFTRFNGEASIDNLDCIHRLEKTESNICLNDDITAEFNFYFSDDYSRINAEKIHIEDGIFSINASMEYEKDTRFAADIRSNRIDLEELSEYITPFYGCDYNGYLEFNGKLLYRLDGSIPENIAIDISLDRFNLYNKTNQKSGLIPVKNCIANFRLDKEKIQLHADIATEKSDFKLSVDTAIKSWNPFSSSTTLQSSSENLELKLVKNGVISFIEFIYDEAFIDMFQNFDEQRNFLKEPEGIFIQNNNLTMDIYAKSLPLAGNCRLNDLNFSLGLVNGTLKTNTFKLNGYSGAFNFDLYAAFRQEYPFIRITGSVVDLDLGAISADSGLQQTFAGKLTSEFKFETNAYRIGQVIENGNASITLNISSGFLNNSDFMKKIHINLAENNYLCDPFDAISFDLFSLDFIQSGSEFYIKKFSVSGPVFNLGGYGRFLNEDAGLKLPLSLQVKNGEEYSRVPLIMTGRLLAPCVKVNDKKSKGEICF